MYDSDRIKTGRFHERGKTMAAGDYHIIVHVWKRNRKGEWLIDKRTPRYGRSDIDGKWETTGGAAVAGDDSLSAALREVREELGIALDPQRGSLFSSIVQKWEDGHTSFTDIWVFDYDEPIDRISFDELEVCDATWAGADKIRELMASGEFLPCPYFDEMAGKWESVIPPVFPGSSYGFSTL